MPAVSVIVPTFNRLKFLKPAIESVYAQTFPDWEIVIADDGSAEETLHYLGSIAGPRARVIRLTHSGNPSRVRNTAVAASTGRYLAFLDSDDVWAPEKLDRQLVALRGNPQSQWSYTAVCHIDEDGTLIPKKRTAPPAPEGWIFKELLTLAIGIAMPTVMTERHLFEKAGGFDERQRFGEFHDLCLRLALAGQVVVVREQLCAVRVHTEHYSSDRISDQAGWLQLYEKMAGIVPNAELRAHCTRMRAETSLSLAKAYGAAGRHGAAGSTLRKAFGFSWRYPRWWWGALKCVARPAVPNALAAIMRKRA
jgi:glycosyltransferase involved in cell wall biosynthesis